MRVEVHHRCSDFNSYRAARVKSLFNADSGCNFDLVADLPSPDEEWGLGVIVGPSGSGKTSLGRKVFGDDCLIYEPNGWAGDKPIIDCIKAGEAEAFDDVTGALAAVGLGTVPSWLRPYAVLSNGEKFRADLAKVIAEAPPRVVVDEFTSVVDRQIAKFGALAFQKAWRRTGGKCVLLSCHYDILEWVEPDWVFDTATGVLSRGRLRRPSFDLEIWQTDGRYWPAFEPHHYLKLPRMVACTYFVGAVDGEPVAHLGITPAFHLNGAVRACRMVIMPEWQGAGIGMRLLNEVARIHLHGESRYGDRPRGVAFHTSHPGLCAALRRDKHWAQVSATLHGGRKRASTKSTMKSAGKRVASLLSGPPVSGYGGHFRAVQGFRASLSIARQQGATDWAKAA